MRADERITLTVQHVNIKIMASQADIDLVDAIPIFHRWIQEGSTPEMLIDVADYKHVPDGPGIMVIGNEADYSLDEQEGRLGLLYNRKNPVDLDDQGALALSFEAARIASKKLEGEAAFAGKLKFDAGDVEVIINDRIIAPNTKATLEALSPEIKKFFAGVYGTDDFVLEHRGEPRERFRVGVKTAKPVDA
jgi:hypothetical protein